MTLRELELFTLAAAIAAMWQQIRTWLAWPVSLLIVRTWVASIERAGGANQRGDSQQHRRSLSSTCLIEVRQADAYWFLVPPLGIPTAGAWVELGTAYESARTIVCSGDTLRSIFPALGHEEERDEDAFAWLQAAFDVRIARSRR